MRSVVGEFLARSKRKGYKKFLTVKDTVPTAEECEKALSKSKNRNDIVKFNDFNEEAFVDIILSTYLLITSQNKEKLHLVWLKLQNSQISGREFQVSICRTV